MNTQEFKAWFAGFTEAIDGVPDAKQWARIKEEAEKITASPLPSYSPLYIPPTYPGPNVTIPSIPQYVTCKTTAGHPGVAAI